MPLLVALTLAGAALRFGTLDVQGFWYDEAVSAGLVRDDLGGMLGRVPESESTPPLYYVVAWLWSKPFGTGEVGLRSLSALLGTAAIPAFWAAARELTRSDRVALGVAALAAFNPLLVWYSQEARAYAMVTLLSALGLLYFARAVRAPTGRSHWGWGVASALSLASHYFAVFLVVPQAVWLLWRPGRRRAVLPPFAFVVVTAAALTPLALHQRSLDLASFIRSSPLPYRVARTLKQYVTGFEAPLELVLTIVAAALLTAGAVVALRRRPPGVVPAAVLAACGILVPALLAGVGLDYFDTRNVLIAWLPLAIVCSSGLLAWRLGPAAVAAVCAIGVAAAVGVAVQPLWQRDNWRGVAEALGPTPVPRAIVSSPGANSLPPLQLYLERTRPLPPRGANVAQVAFVSTSERRLEELHTPEPPRPRVPPTLSGFGLLRRVYADSFTVIVLEARAGRPHVSPRSLTGKRLLRREGAGLLLQLPSGPRR